ncbi:MAG: hypothetical protein CEE38_07030 [Planctomycetes bacterium B3_Pla]|nr:MAG: hypothetical protein CEE38_07030 [Planctomycetes bacterium B3_Pla]
MTQPRQMRQEDIKAVGDLWKTEYKNEHPLDPDEKLNSRLDSMVQDDLPEAVAASSGYVCEARGKIIGFMTLTTPRSKPYIDNLYVSSEHRRQRVATKLVTKAQELHDSLTLHVFQDAIPAIKLYEKCGFKCKYCKVGENKDKNSMEWSRR